MSVRFVKFDTEQLNQQIASMMLKLLLKIFLNTLTILVVLFACLFSLARIGSLFAPNYVDNLNQRFAEQGLEFSDLTVSWRGINPVIEIGEITSSSLHIEDITAELDTLASFWRNTYVFRTIQVEHVALNVVEQSACRFELPESGDSTFSIDTLLHNAKTVDVAFSSSLTCGSANFEHEGFFRTVTQNDLYRLHATISDLAECDHCSISLLYESSSRGFWRRTQERVLNVQAHDFVVPTSLLGWDFLEETVLNAQVLMNGTSASASLIGNIDLQPTDPVENPAGLFLDLSFGAEELGFAGKIDASLVDRNNEVVAKLEHFVQQNLNTNHVHGWSHDVSAETVNTFMSIFGVSGHPIRNMVDGLAPTGTLATVQWVQDSTGVVYWAAVDQLGLQQYRGIPSLTLDSLVLTGRGALILAEATTQQIDIEEGRFIFSPFSLTTVDFSGLAMWKQDYLGSTLYGHWIPTPDADAIDFNIEFSKYFPSARQRVKFALDAPSVSATQLRPSLGAFVPQDAFTWIENAVNQAQFNEARLQFVHSMNELNQQTSSIEIFALIDDAKVTFLEDWPEIIQGSGRFWLTRDGLMIEVTSAYTHGSHIEKGTIFLPLAEPLLELEFTADSNFLLLQSYLVDTPITELLPFDPLEYDGSGAIDLMASMKVPLTPEQESLWDVHLELVLADVSLDILPADIQLDDAFGSVGYQFPHFFSSSELSATFYNDPVSLNLSTRDGGLDSPDVVFAFDLNTSVDSISHVTGEWIHSIASGTPQVSGEIVFPINGETTPTIDVRSDLIGVTLTLPKPFHKVVDHSRPMHVHIKLAEPMTVDITMDELNIHTVEAAGSPMRGSVGLGVPPPQITQSTRDWLIAGNVSELVFPIDQSSDTSLPAGLDIEFDDLRINKLVRGRFQLHDLVLDGTFGGESSALTATAEEGSASLSREQGQEWNLSVEQLRFWLSAFDTPDDAPMDPAIFLQLPPVSVSIQDLYLFNEDGEAEDFGSWSFELETTDREVHLQDVVADIRGVTVDTRDHVGIVWDTEKNETRFNGVISGDNLLQVLPKFDVEAEIESENFTVNSDLVWPGSPFDVDALKMSGRIHGDAYNGTLLEVDAGQGILRLLSMFNIASIIQGMNFNPTSVFAKGFQFDRILYDVTLDQSIVQIKEPIHIKGRSSELMFSGNANLADASLTMDVVVRLPFTTNLKWYVALMTGNPTAFLGTLIGSRIFKSQLNRISSAKYRVEGTFETPEIELIGFFNDDLSESPTEGEVIDEE